MFYIRQIYQRSLFTLLLIMCISGADTTLALDTPADLSLFLQNHWQRTLHNDASAYAEDFASNADYWVSSGRTGNSRDFIAKDRQEFIDRWPSREYGDAAMASFMVSPEECRYTMEFDYKYSNGVNAAAGHSLEVVDVQKINGQWKITHFDEGAAKSLPKLNSTSAGSAAKIVSDLGLLGTWIANGGWKQVFAVERGQATVTQSESSTVPTTYNIRSARVVGDRIILEESKADSNVGFVVSYAMIGHSIRIWDSRTKDTVYVKGGISQKMNEPSEWFTRAK